MSSSSFVIVEALSAEIFLEQCSKTAAPQTNFFASTPTESNMQFPIDSNSNADDPTILFTSTNHLNFHYSSPLFEAFNALPTIDLSRDDAREHELFCTDDVPRTGDEQAGHGRSVQLFDTPDKVPIFNTSAQQTEAGFLGYCLDSGAPRRLPSVFLVT